MTDAEFQNQILDERHRELYAEGQRWYDLKRPPFGLVSSLTVETT